MNIAVVGLTHKTAPVEVREKLSIPEPVCDKAIAQLCSYPHIEEVAVLSTCNRLELYLVTSETEQGIREVNQFLSEHSKLPSARLRPYLFTLLHQDAVMHLMRVSAGLDSLVLGEGQILAQVKQCHKLGQQHQGIGRILNQLFKQGISAGKRVRTETSIGTGAVSISSAAVELAQMKVDSLADQRVTIIGAGKMSRLLVQHLLSKGANNIVILNRSMNRARELANLFPDAHLRLLPIEDMMDAIAQSDIVFTSTSSTEPILDRANLEPVLDANQPLMVIDIAVPRNVAADVNELPMVRAFNVDDLKAVVAQNQESRRQMAMEAEALLEEEVETFQAWWRSLETVSTISCLRDKVEAIRAQELEKALSRLGTEFGDRHREVIEALTKGIVNKILHDPMVQLRAQQDIEARRQAMETLELLFNLESPQARV
ncbi:glutamyl-tRNA reductase [Leptolyngbya boryana CZ1]|jgi:glutamyl-tRNA reductase|uniref:Glutamyl-tRNA reductase n=2 Tax=Leptolyngbya boryana TaxID=1184 RepID=A0A1Z4JL62_LEPBY|nr:MULTISPECIES: glutamyl-tRNA reductase [Leptolyngbya]BAY57502.1 glutamyl-tRNA reductase [Leptolyngbya boryana NIES-2135]MBD1859220.1 glutamyl-tRNA reductase [Leptolyngbya sp. FACHB-1624]MBD2368561.1 glutamyl-tRNA reductase [Leptolyngbya sp. FACHB-161]MBD2375178.1 glutamyl-tRNA reductase [Leptolyngbya sp. FACHB-238]MBD2399597.1 glutamyl-tRNA reductase [Leptolyngbya sp. FACHB-239]